MERTTNRRRILLACIVGAAAAWSTPLLAQIQDGQLIPATRSIPGEHVSVGVGDVFEIQAVTGIPDAEYAWVLTRERTFIEAGRQQVFRIRLTDPGTYLLEAGMQSPDRSLQERRTFSVDVLPRTGPTSSGGAAGAVSVSPTPVAGRIALGDRMRVITLTPNRSETFQRFFVDVDGDGNPDNAETYAATDGTPLFLWMASDALERTIRWTILESDGSEENGSVTVTSGGVAAQQPAQASGSIETASSPDGSILFTLALAPGSRMPQHSLYEWSFGDGLQSLVDRPHHRYAGSGVYDVRVVVRDLESGQSVLEATKSIEVTATAPAPPTTGPEPSPPPPSPEPQPSNGSWFRLLNIILLGLASIVAAALLVWAVTRLLRRTGGLQRTLEEVESRLVPQAGQNGDATDVIDVPKPLELRRAESKAEPEAAAEAPEREPTSQPEPEPRMSSPQETETGPAPSWLVQGMRKEPEEPPEPEESPAPPWLQAAPPEREVPEPEMTTEPPAEEQLPLAQPTATEEPAPEPTPPAAPLQPLPPEPDDALQEPATSVDASKEIASPEDDARSEKERERRRLKRQRYRANLKRRREAEKASTSEPMPPPPVPPPATPIEPASSTSTPAASPQRPVPPASPPPEQPDSPSDDDVAFLISADSVQPPAADAQKQHSDADGSVPPPELKPS